MAEIKNKTIVIAGAASGLGRAWVEGFHKEGAQIVASVSFACDQALSRKRCTSKILTPRAGRALVQISTA